MKFSKETIAILKNFSIINGGMVFRPGKMVSVCNNSKSVIAVSPIEEELPIQFAIYDVRQLMSIVAMLGDPEITLTEECMTLKTKNSTVQYGYTNELNVISPPEDFSVEMTPLGVQITIDEISKLMKAASIMKLSEFSLYIGEGKFIMIVEAKDDPDGNIFSIQRPYDGDIELDMMIPVSSLTMPAGDYDISISKGNTAIEFSCGELSYTIAVSV